MIPELTLQRLREPDGGFTVDQTGSDITDGFAVAIPGEALAEPVERFLSDRFTFEHRIHRPGPSARPYWVTTEAHRARADAVEAWLERVHGSALVRGFVWSGAVGGWHDPSTGWALLEPVTIYSSEHAARTMGRIRGQVAIARLRPGPAEVIYL